MSAPPPQPGDAARETGRVEAFSDGVFAIAMTLLVLDLHVPRAGDPELRRGLAQALLKQWPTYLAYVSSFLTVLIMWVNHHRLFTLIRRVDHGCLMLNGLLLMGVTVVPFPTSLVAEHLRTGDQRAAAMVYGGTYTVIAILFNLLWHYAARDGRLLGEDVDPAWVRGVTRSYLLGPPLYFAGFLLGMVNAAASLTLFILLALFYALPPSTRRGE